MEIVSKITRRKFLGIVSYFCVETIMPVSTIVFCRDDNSKNNLLKTGNRALNRFSEDVILTIKNRVDIVDVISKTVLMKKVGRNLVGLCPFHLETKLSFTVSPAKQTFYCFGCGTGGNVFSFTMKQYGLTFHEAVQYLA